MAANSSPVSIASPYVCALELRADSLMFSRARARTGAQGSARDRTLERVIGALLNAVGLGIFEMSWNGHLPKLCRRALRQ